MRVDERGGQIIITWSLSGDVTTSPLQRYTPLALIGNNAITILRGVTFCSFCRHTSHSTLLPGRSWCMIRGFPRGIRGWPTAPYCSDLITLPFVFYIGLNTFSAHISPEHYTRSQYGPLSFNTRSVRFWSAVVA